MEGFDSIALYDVDESIVRGGDRMIVSKIDYDR